MSIIYLGSTRKEFLGKAPIKKVELSTSIQIDPALTDKTSPKRKEPLSEGSGKSSRAAGAIEEVAVIKSEMTRGKLNNGNGWLPQRCQ